MMQIEPWQIALTYAPNIAWLGFHVVCLILSILYFKRTKRKPFRLLSISFLLSVVQGAYYIAINGAFLVYYLSDVLRISPSTITIIVLFGVNLPTQVITWFAAALLLVAVIQFYKERKE